MRSGQKVLVGLLVVLLVAVGGLVGWLFLQPETPADEPVEEPEAFRAPLTGGQVDEPIEHSVVATKVSNIEEARPQRGLAQADIVFEVVTEGGITRFIALFHSAVPDDTGPIRSARDIDVDVVPPYQAILAVSGGRDEVMSEARSHLEVVTEGPGFFRTEDRQAPHNLYLRPGEILDLVDGPPPPQDPVWDFDEEVPADGTPETQLTIELSHRAETGWRYDESEGAYRRLQNGEPHELEDGEIGAANVVIIGTSIEPIDDELVDIQIVGDGDAVVLRDGQRYDVRWEKASREDHLRLVTGAGEDLTLKPGSTWVVIAPEDNLTPAPS